MPESTPMSESTPPLGPTPGTTPGPSPGPSPHRFRLKRGEWELELEGARDYVEAQIAAVLPLLLAVASPERLSELPDARRAEPAPGSSRPAPAAEAAARPEGAETTDDPFPRVRPDFQPQTRTSLGEFVALKGAVAPADLVVAAAYYLEKYRRQANFTPAELARALRELPAWEGQALDEPLERCLVQGLLEAVRDGRYTTTFKGQNYVRDGLA